MTVTANLVLDNGSSTITKTLSGHAMAALTCALPDNPQWSEVFDILSGHDNYSVREAVARYEFLSDHAVHRLSADPAIKVVMKLVANSSASKRLTQPEVLAICRRDPELAALVAARFEDFLTIDSEVLNLLANHVESLVRLKLACNPFVPKSVLIALVKHDRDEDVRESARECLE